mgnify:FL=1
MEIRSYAPGGYQGTVVTVEVDCRTGIPGLDIVGLPANEVKEARERARVAIRNSGFQLPPRRILISLAPADLQKSGNGFDLAIALAILQGTGQIDGSAVHRLLVVGELRLDGRVSGVRGVLAAVSEAAEQGVKHVIVPASNEQEAVCIPGVIAYGVSTLSEIPASLASLMRDRGTRTRAQQSRELTGFHPATRPAPPTGSLTDYRELRGLVSVKRMLQIAAAGGHHALLIGPPGVGKSAALSLFPTIMPPLTSAESIEVSRIHSLAGSATPPGGLFSSRPFREPHHNSTTEGLLGGGNPVRPGEVALAHRGALFLDEALEFRRPVLQGLREPMERGRIVVSRAGRRFWFPADFQLLLAANPCPCGMLGRHDRVCLCSVAEVERYWKRIGGPLLDRVDLRMAVNAETVMVHEESDSSAAIRGAVVEAVSYRRQRGGRTYNRALPGVAAREACDLTPDGERLVRRVSEQFGFSTRATVSLLRVSRTIADLAGAARVTEEHILEATAYRKSGESEPLWDAGLLDRVG